MFAQQPRLAVDQRHRVLQLIAEAEGAARLVVAAARPETAGKSLIEQPAVGQHIERRVRCFHVDRAQRVLPILPHAFQGAASGLRSAEAAGQLPGLLGIAGGAQREHHLAFFPGRQVDGNLQGGARIQACAGFPGHSRTRHRRRAGERAVASQKLPPVAGQSVRRLAGAEERDPAGKLGVVGIAREDGSAAGVHFGHHVHRCFGPQIAQHPLHVTGDREPARAAGIVAELQHGEFDGCVGGHVHPDLRVDSALAVFEHAVAEPVAADIGLHARGRAWAWATRSARSPRRGDSMPRRRYRSPDRCPTESGGTRGRFPPRYKPYRFRRPRFRNSRWPAR